jgi:hypothetical protein
MGLFAPARCPTDFEKRTSNGGRLTFRTREAEDMRVFGHCAAAGYLAAAVALTGASSFAPSVPVAAAVPQAKDAAAILAAARQALGGEARLSAVKSFAATGRTRQVRGDNLVPIEFEIFVEFPDKYLRKDEVPAQESGPTATGFNGEEFLQDPPQATPPGPPPGAGGAAPNPAMLEAARKARVTNVKQDFARLMLGMFAASFPTYPLTFTYVGEAEAPQGKADVLDAKAPNNFTIRFFISQQNHLPIMVSWQGAAPGRGRPGGPGMPGAGPGGPGRAVTPPGERGAASTGDRGAPPPGERGVAPAGDRGAGAPAGERGAPAPGAQAAPPGERGAPTPTGERGAAPPAGERGTAPPGARGMPPGGAPGGAPPPENRLYFGDYRDVDGMQFPFRLRRAVGPDTVEETTFDRFRINARIDARRFEVRK